MRKVQASHAETHLPGLLDEVEKGETIVITRFGKPVARLVPEAYREKANVAHVMADIAEFRKTMPRLSVEDILLARHDGHKY